MVVEGKWQLKVNFSWSCGAAQRYNNTEYCTPNDMTQGRSPADTYRAIAYPYIHTFICSLFLLSADAASLILG